MDSNEDEVIHESEVFNSGTSEQIIDAVVSNSIILNTTDSNYNPNTVQREYLTGDSSISSPATDQYLKRTRCGGVRAAEVVNLSSTPTTHTTRCGSAESASPNLKPIISGTGQQSIGERETPLPSTSETIISQAPKLETIPSNSTSISEANRTTTYSFDEPSNKQTVEQTKLTDGSIQTIFNPPKIFHRDNLPLPSSINSTQIEVKSITYSRDRKTNIIEATAKDANNNNKTIKITIDGGPISIGSTELLLFDRGDKVSTFYKDGKTYLLSSDGETKIATRNPSQELVKIQSDISTSAVKVSEQAKSYATGTPIANQFEHRTKRYTDTLDIFKKTFDSLHQFKQQFPNSIDETATSKLVNTMKEALSTSLGIKINNPELHEFLRKAVKEQTNKPASLNEFSKLIKKHYLANNFMDILKDAVKVNNRDFNESNWNELISQRQDDLAKQSIFGYFLNSFPSNAYDGHLSAGTREQKFTAHQHHLRAIEHIARKLKKDNFLKNDSQVTQTVQIYSTLSAQLYQQELNKLYPDRKKIVNPKAFHS